ARVDAQVPRELLQLVRVLDDLRRDVLDLVDRGPAPPVDLLAPRVLLPRREAERLGDVAYRRPRPVRDDVRDLGGVLATVLVVDVLDGLLPSTRLDVQVDVRVPVALRREEPLEQQ